MIQELGEQGKNALLLYNVGAWQWTITNKVFNIMYLFNNSIFSYSENRTVLAARALAWMVIILIVILIIVLNVLTNIRNKQRSMLISFTLRETTCFYPQ